MFDYRSVVESLQKNMSLLVLQPCGVKDTTHMIPNSAFLMVYPESGRHHMHNTRHIYPHISINVSVLAKEFDGHLMFLVSSILFSLVQYAAVTRYIFMYLDIYIYIYRKPSFIHAFSKVNSPASAPCWWIFTTLIHALLFVTPSLRKAMAIFWNWNYGLWPRLWWHTMVLGRMVEGPMVSMLTKIFIRVMW